MSSKLRHFLKNVGPGVITGASDDDPSGIATYSQAGAQFGLTTLWVVFITLPLMFVIQEMCARIGLATSNGLIANIQKNYPSSLIYFIMLCLFPAVILNIGADISAMAAVSNMLCPFIPRIVFSIFFAVLLIFIMIKFSYKKVAKYLKFLCLSLFLYIIVPFVIDNKNWAEILKNMFIPHIQMNKEFMGILIAILGTTISPYMFFWQATMEAEETRHKVIKLTNNQMKKMRIDVGAGMFLSNIIMYFIILTTGIVLFQHGNHEVNTVAQAAKALEPVAGKFSYLLFSMGIIGTGLLTVPVLCSSISYIFTSAFHCKEGLDKKLNEAKIFYAIISTSLLLGLLIDFIGLNPIKMLIYAAIFYGIIAPLLILIILLIVNNKKIMGKFTNGVYSNIFGVILFLMMAAAAIAFLII